jgi:hypothetical protein
LPATSRGFFLGGGGRRFDHRLRGRLGLGGRRFRVVRVFVLVVGHFDDLDHLALEGLAFRELDLVVVLVDDLRGGVAERLEVVARRLVQFLVLSLVGLVIVVTSGGLNADADRPGLLAVLIMLVVFVVEMPFFADRDVLALAGDTPLRKALRVGGLTLATPAAATSATPPTAPTGTAAFTALAAALAAVLLVGSLTARTAVLWELRLRLLLAAILLAALIALISSLRVTGTTAFIAAISAAPLSSTPTVSAAAISAATTVANPAAFVAAFVAAATAFVPVSAAIPSITATIVPDFLALRRVAVFSAVAGESGL